MGGGGEKERERVYNNGLRHQLFSDMSDNGFRSNREQTVSCGYNLSCNCHWIQVATLSIIFIVL